MGGGVVVLGFGLGLGVGMVIVVDEEVEEEVEVGLLESSGIVSGVATNPPTEDLC